MQINYIGIDHLVLTVHSIQDSIDFYCRLLGKERAPMDESYPSI